MNDLVTHLRVAGTLHFAILIASAMVPGVLDWKNQLARLDKHVREVVWVHGIFIVLVIVSFGALLVARAGDLATGSPLARWTAGIIALFWGVRLILQFVLFKPSEWVDRWWLLAGYHALTVVFAYITTITTWAALTS